MALAWRGRWGEAFAANEKAMALVPWSAVLSPTVPGS